jgi:NAD(P)-dependent dehydrogenase (short-subunit alcohol dehydrogenase family)
VNPRTGTKSVVIDNWGGLGRQLAEQLLDRGAARLYAATLTLASLESLVALSPQRVVPLELDITNDSQVAAAAAAAQDVRW